MYVFIYICCDNSRRRALSTVLVEKAVLARNISLA
jgi:hypothetical protein